MRILESISGKVINLAAITLGTAIYAFGLHYFVIPNELMEGGVTGISLLLHYILSVPTWLTTLVVNIPLFYLGWRAFGRYMMFYTIYGTLSLSLFLWIFELIIDHGWLEPFATKQDYFLATLYAGVTIGGGLGIVFRFGGTTGGADIIARLGQKYKGYSMGKVILIIDVLVIGLSLLYIPKEKVLYTLVAVFVGSKMIDFITEGGYGAKEFTIFSKHTEKISNTIQANMERGVTLFAAKGGYIQEQKDVIYCVVYRSEMKMLRDLIRSIDPEAFIIIADVHDVLGEGFRRNVD